MRDLARETSSIIPVNEKPCFIAFAIIVNLAIVRNNHKVL